MFDPDWVSQQMDDFWQNKNPIAKENSTGGMTYFWTHAARTIGDRQFDYHLSVPTSAVYLNPKTNTTTYIVYNPKATEPRATVYKGSSKVGTLLLAPSTITIATKLQD